MKSNIMPLFMTILIIIAAIAFFPTKVQSAQINSRLSNLESDLHRVELRLNNLESQLSNSPSSPSSRTKPQLTTPPSQRKLSSRERDKMFDRLATLVIELKQDVRKLQQRVSQLESN
ncbi:MAG: hypothetical protein AAF378_06360 [Cyanobacteria bacterium P01_A01_bin.84]